MYFWTYILKCSDESMYVGHTDNLEQRMQQHENGSYPGYTAIRLPVKLLYSAEFPDRDQAFAMERKLKGWTRAKKLALISGDWEAVKRSARKKDHVQPTLRQAQGERNTLRFS